MISRLCLSRQPLAALSLAIGLALSLAALLLAAHGDTQPRKGASASVLGMKQLPPSGGWSVGPCTGTGGAIAEVGQTTGTQPNIPGVTVQAIDDFNPSFVVINANEAGTAGSIDGFLTTGTVASRSKDPAYSTCDYKATDSPGAAAMVATARTYLQTNGIVDASTLAAPQTIYLVSDDPTNSRRLIVSCLKELPINLSSPPPVASSVIPFAVVVDKVSGQAIGGGRAHWFDFQPASPPFPAPPSPPPLQPIP